MDVTTSIVANAARQYREGKYREALALYQKAANTYGSALFKANIMLCEQRLQPKGKAPVLLGSPAVSRQLTETQELLEYYYHRCQELEYTLLDNAALNHGQEKGTS